jgi:hypothetical protein
LIVFNTPRLPVVALFAALVAAALGLAACGPLGDDDGDADKVLKETFSGAKKVDSGRLSLSLSLKAEGSQQLSRPVTIKLSGPFQSQGPRKLPKFDFDLALSTGGRAFTAGAVSTGNAGFLKFQGQSYSLPANVFESFKQGYERSQQQQRGNQDTSFSALGVDPRNWLEDAEDKGEADVAGTETTHIAAKVDVPRLLEDVNKILQRASRLGVSQQQQLPNQLTPQQRKQVEDAVESASFELYSGKGDRILRRMVIKLDFKVPESSRQQAGGLTGGDLGFDLELADLNQPQTVTAPSRPRSFQELTRQIREAFGSLGAGTGGSDSGGTPGGGTTTTPGAGEERAQEYLRCLQEAGGDVAKAQRCASILQGG